MFMNFQSKFIHCNFLIGIFWSQNPVQICYDTSYHKNIKTNIFFYQNKMSKYDEDINENPFFIKQMSHLTSFENVVVILVPQKKSVLSKFHLEDFKDQILIEKSQDDLQTQNGQNIQIKDSMVKYGELEVPILFSETHYGQDLEKVKILCIKRPLTEASFEFHDEVGK